MTFDLLMMLWDGLMKDLTVPCRTIFVIKLLNCMTGLSNLTNRVRHWLPWPCYLLYLWARFPVKPDWFFCLFCFLNLLICVDVRRKALHTLKILNYTLTFLICYYASSFYKNPIYGQQLALSYVCDSGVPKLYHKFKSTPWLLSIP